MKGTRSPLTADLCGALVMIHNIYHAGIILARPQYNFAARLPHSLEHLKACFTAFTSLDQHFQHFQLA